MSSFRRLYKNTLAMLVAKGSQPILSMVLAVCVARTLGVESFGKFSTVFYFFMIFQITSAFGLKTLITRNVAQKPDLAANYFINGAILSVPLGMMSILIMNGTVALIGYDSATTQAVLIVSISLIASSFSETVEGVLSGLEDLSKVSIIWVVTQVVKLGASILFILMGYGLVSVFVIHTLSKFIQPALGYRYVKQKVGTIKFKFDPSFTKEMLRSTWVFALIMFATSLYWRIDTIMLSKMTSMGDVGIYNAGYKFFWLIIILVRSFFTAFFPMISSFYQSDEAKFENACKISIRYLFILTLPVCLLFTVFADPIVHLIFGDEFLKAIPVMQILIWALIPYAISEVFAYAMVASNNQNVDLRINVVALAIKIVLNYFLISKYGLVGATWATLISITILLLQQLPFVLKNLIRLDFSKMLGPSSKFLLSGGLMFIASLYLKSFNFMIGMAISITVYFSMLFILKAFTDEDKMLFKRILKKA